MLTYFYLCRGGKCFFYLFCFSKAVVDDNMNSMTGENRRHYIFISSIISVFFFASPN